MAAPHKEAKGDKKRNKAKETKDSPEELWTASLGGRKGGRRTEDGALKRRPERINNGTGNASVSIATTQSCRTGSKVKSQRANRRYECEPPPRCRRGPTANIDKDIRGDRCGSSWAAGLITESDAGKQTPTAGEAAAAWLQEDDSGGRIKGRTAGGISNPAFLLSFTASLYRRNLTRNAAPFFT